MAIARAQFDCEQELHDWATSNIASFLPNSLYVPGFQVKTTSGKKGVPDGFAFNFQDREWFVIESELLDHGVWPHIAEQVVRFVVAMQSSESRRKIRDRLFDFLIESGRVDKVLVSLDTTPERLLQKLELFIEGIRPEVVIFIDETNRDLHDMAEALAVSARVFRIQKFVVNGSAEYHSPDSNAPVLDTDKSESRAQPKTDFDLIEVLGGGTPYTSKGRFKSYNLADGTIIHIKRSKFYTDNNYYWYGINASTLAQFDEHGVSHVAFVMGDEGCALVPVESVNQFCTRTKASRNPDGSVRHYHALISPPPTPELYWSNEVPRFSLAECYISF